MSFVGALIFLPETADSDITCNETSTTATGRLVQPPDFFRERLIWPRARSAAGR